MAEDDKQKMLLRAELDAALARARVVYSWSYERSIDSIRHYFSLTAFNSPSSSLIDSLDNLKQRIPTAEILRAAAGALITASGVLQECADVVEKYQAAQAASALANNDG